MTEAAVEVPIDMHTVRRALSRHLRGSGIELGPGPHPFPVEDEGASVAYVDRWDPDELHDLFTELDDYEFVKPDYACDLNIDMLRMIESTSQDFVIASHVLEHVANPLRLLDEIHRVLCPGGVALVLLPDMSRTFDHTRPVTTLDHIIGEFEADVVQVDDHHVDEFLRHTEDDYEATVRSLSPEARAKLFELHRRRSIHVHCWTQEDFLPVIEYAITDLGHRWELVDGILVDDEGPDGFEFGYVMRRSESDLTADAVAAEFRRTLASWTEFNTRTTRAYEALRWSRNELEQTQRSLDDALADLAHVTATVAHLDGVLAEVQRQLDERFSLRQHALLTARHIGRRVSERVHRLRSSRGSERLAD